MCSAITGGDARTHDLDSGPLASAKGASNERGRLIHEIQPSGFPEWCRKDKWLQFLAEGKLYKIASNDNRDKHAKQGNHIGRG